MQCLIDTHLEELKTKQHQKHIEIAFFGGSFTGLPVSHQEMYLSLAYNYKKAGLIDGIRLSTRPDYIDREILSILTKYGVTTIELGVQSLDEDVLGKSKRGHTLSAVVNACHLIKEYQIHLGLQMMIGLPGDTPSKTRQTADEMIRLKPDFVRIYPTLIIKDTELETLYNNHLYSPLELEEAVVLSADLVALFTRHELPIIRLGLQPTEELNGSAVIAGPYHPAFRQLVMTHLYKKKLDRFFKNRDKLNQITIYISSKEISNLVGQKRANLIPFERRFNIKRIKVKAKEMTDQQFEIEADDRLYTIMN